jgi:pilus assembly protein CpaF
MAALLAPCWPPSGLPCGRASSSRRRSSPAGINSPSSKTRRQIRGADLFDFFWAPKTAHAGSLSTIHAKSAVQALARFTNCVLQADVDLPYPAIRAMIADSVGLVVHLALEGARRVVRELVRVERYDHASNRFVLAPIEEQAS